MMIFGTAGNDDLSGTGDPDDFFLGDGGNDIARGLGGEDSFAFGATFNGHDRVFGGAGIDTIFLAAAPSPLHISGHTIDGIEQLFLGDGSDYELDMSGSAIAGRNSLVVNGGGLTIGHSLKLFASTELRGNYIVVGGADSDLIETGGGNDTIDGSGGADVINSGYGRDTINGDAGEDTIYFLGDGAFGAGDRVNGGTGINTLVMLGDYSGGFTVTSKMLVDVHRVMLGPTESYALDFSHANAGLGIVEIDADALVSGDALSFTAAGNKHVGFTVLGGAGNDTMTASKTDNNTLQGNGGADLATGNKGDDTFWYETVADSTGPDYDTVVGFDARAADLITAAFVPGGGLPAAVDPSVKHGTLSAATFNADLEHLVGAGELGADSAVLFRAKHGDLAGQWFLIVDGNGTAGYQAEEDLVVHLQDPVHIGDFDLADFGAVV